jgi:hypothetical protein
MVTLSGTGVASGPNATLSATSLTFATQAVGTTSAQSLTLTNYGTVAVSITRIGLAGADSSDFAETNTCGNPVAPGASCTISVTFTPKGINARTATLSIADNAPGTPHNVPLTGKGTWAELNPTSVSFYRGWFWFHEIRQCLLLVNGSPFGQPLITLTNVGNTALNITNMLISGAFSQTNNCPVSLAAAQSCTITVKWSGVNSTGVLSVSDNGGGSPQTVPLTGGKTCP